MVTAVSIATVEQLDLKGDCGQGGPGARVADTEDTCSCEAGLGVGVPPSTFPAAAPDHG